MECFGNTDFDNNSRLITLSAIIISGLHCTTNYESFRFMQFSDLLPLGQVHIFPRQVVIQQPQFANIILHKISVIDKVSLQTTSVSK